ncbi:hypothetical protein FB446DRAFT_729969 [Lentinula raphanica]|nr:hypothetical protein FB446DRAFT_729969 [Lentinula raphanica]
MPNIHLTGSTSVAFLGLTVARIHHTTHTPLGDPLNSGQDFYGEHDDDDTVPTLIINSQKLPTISEFHSLRMGGQSNQPNDRLDEHAY